MPDEIGPVRRVSASRRAGDYADDAHEDDGRVAGDGENLPVPIGAARTHDEPHPTEAQAAAFAAQLLGQPGIKRGLRGGPETLGKARSAYLGAEWSGPNDRRPAPGRITKTEV